MSDFNQSNRFGGGRGGGQRFRGRDSGRRSFGDRDSERSMHRATCAECGNDCEVPFRPSGDRPVYCSNCFEKRSKEDGRGSRFEERRSASPTFDSNRNKNPQFSEQIVDQLKNLNTKLDKIISVMEPSVIEPKVVEPVVLEPKVKKPKAPKKKASEEPVIN